MKNDLYLRSLRGEKVERTPIWVMRQAGRYLPEYRAVRKQAGDFLTLCKTPELACEVTMQPIDRFGLDAAILFSDILTIPDAMGLELTIEVLLAILLFTPPYSLFKKQPRLPSSSYT